MQFHLRDVFWVLFVASVLFGWFQDHRRLAQRIELKAQWEEKAKDLAAFCERCGWTVKWIDKGDSWESSYTRSAAEAEIVPDQPVGKIGFRNVIE